MKVELGDGGGRVSGETGQQQLLKEEVGLERSGSTTSAFLHRRHS